MTPLNEAVARQPDLWNEIQERQKFSGSPHGDTETIFLRWCKGLNLHSAFTEIPAFDCLAMGKLLEAHEHINYALSLASGQKLGRVLIVKLRPGGVITPHIDEGDYADHYERFHVVLKSQAGVLFTCGNEAVQMKAGEVWWFNHKEVHEVHNLSQSDRIHMMVDMVAPKFRRERMPLAV